MTKGNNKKVKPKKITLPKDKQKEAEEIIAELNDRQKAFCREYCMHLNSVKAYMKIYPDSTYDSACASGPRLLGNVRIKEYVKYLQDNLEELTGITKARNLQELAKIAYSNISDLHNSWIERKKFESLTIEQKACIQIVDSFVDVKNIGGNSQANQNIVKIEMVKIKCYSKTEAIKLINEMLGYNKPIEVNSNVLTTVIQLPLQELKESKE